MDMTEIAKILISLITAISGAVSSGWGGLALLAFAVIGGGAGITWFIRKINKQTDSKDMDRSGEAAGQIGSDLARQAKGNEDILDRLEKQNPVK